MRIEWTLPAMEDREAIFDYIEADSPGWPSPSTTKSKLKWIG